MSDAVAAQPLQDALRAQAERRRVLLRAELQCVERELVASPPVGDADARFVLDLQRLSLQRQEAGLHLVLLVLEKPLPLPRLRRVQRSMSSAQHFTSEIIPPATAPCCILL